ncbi:hypothetical protein F5141DRAFT_1068120 [Pisolithus sp. B1]|nr:hypothetical protein F5141DRAFT_1068120 [Pisolithus sp. B1]
MKSFLVDHSQSDVEWVVRHDEFWEWRWLDDWFIVVDDRNVVDILVTDNSSTTLNYLSPHLNNIVLRKSAFIVKGMQVCNQNTRSTATIAGNEEKAQSILHQFHGAQAAELGLGMMADCWLKMASACMSLRECSGHAKDLFGIEGEEENVTFYYNNFMNQGHGVLAYEQKVEEIGHSDNDLYTEWKEAYEHVGDTLGLLLNEPIPVHLCRQSHYHLTLQEQ